MILSTLQKKLNELGFEAIVSNGVVQASKETGDTAVEITIDSGGGCLVVVKEKMRDENGEMGFKGKQISIVCEKLSTKTFRVQLESEDDLRLIDTSLLL